MKGWMVEALIVAVLLALAGFVVLEDAGAHYGGSTSTTAYCLNGTTADGSRVNRAENTLRMRRTAASNTLPLGTRIRIVGRHGGPTGVRWFVVRDRIGYGTELDLWTNDCSRAFAFGRHGLRYRIGWRR